LLPAGAMLRIHFSGYLTYLDLSGTTVRHGH
jgi:hypothetical protein